jgi:hypothetical protein
MAEHSIANKFDLSVNAEHSIANKFDLSVNVNGTPKTKVLGDLIDFMD